MHSKRVGKYNKKQQYTQKVELLNVSLTRVILYLVGAFLAYSFVNNAIVKYYITKHKYGELEKKLQVLKKENSSLKNILEALKSDYRTKEYYVRKELGYMKKGEKVYIIKEKNESK